MDFRQDRISHVPILPFSCVASVCVGLGRRPRRGAVYADSTPPLLSHDTFRESKYTYVTFFHL